MTPNTSPGRLLVVDDDARLVEWLDEVLPAEGFVVRSATSCSAAPEVATQGFDVAVIEMRLLDGGGADPLGPLRVLAPNAKMILTTGSSNIEAVARAVGDGAFALLTKPLVTQHMLSTVREALVAARAVGEQRKAAHQLQMSERLAAIGTMTAGLAHEIRNPLNAASLQLLLLEGRVDGLTEALRPALQALLRLTRNELERLANLLQDFLQMAQPPEPRLAEVELGAVIHRVLDSFDQDAQ